MDTTTATLIGLGILALVVIAFLAVFRRKGKFSIKTKLGEADSCSLTDNEDWKAQHRVHRAFPACRMMAILGNLHRL